ncbi:hypothetical protein [Rossellomorea sp. KS-H15a]|uniref:hypothetical protein n=1 Tax=Rossellomorea sp. KS-H15a TaxID=2963940 RepID=UPI0020C6CB34|nr:hypothetical protein [Rossellomorea sp. KS-H15a]UTE79135.1 hypothetical protein M1J35_10560 [Rossellomorea sp. KS-H15a]
MIGVQEEDSYGKSGIGNPAGALATRRLAFRPRKAKSCTEINSGVTSDPNYLLNGSALEAMDLNNVKASFC